jgi:Flp pilus assembly protein protease CpaA
VKAKHSPAEETLNMSTGYLVPFVVAVGAVGVATVTDIRTLKVHNILTFPLLISGLLYHLMVGGLEGLATNVLAVVGISTVMLFLYVLGAMGAGDVKLVAGLAAWLGSVAVLVLAVGLFVSAIYSLAVLSCRGQLADTWFHLKLTFYRAQVLAQHVSLEDEHESIHELAQTPGGRRRLVPFSVMLGISVVVILLVQFCSR